MSDGQETKEFWAAEFDVTIDFVFPPTFRVAMFPSLLSCDLNESDGPGSPRRSLVSAWTSSSARNGMEMSEFRAKLKLAMPVREFIGRRPVARTGKSRIKALAAWLMAFVGGVAAALGYIEGIDERAAALFVHPFVQVTTAKDVVELPVGPLDDLKIAFDIRNMQQHGNCTVSINTVNVRRLDPGPSGLMLTSPTASGEFMPPFAPGSSSSFPTVLKGYASVPGDYEVRIGGESKAGRFGGRAAVQGVVRLRVRPKLLASQPEFVAVQEGGKACRCRFDVFHGVALPHGYAGSAQLQDARISITQVFGAQARDPQAISGGVGEKRVSSLAWNVPRVDAVFAPDPNTLYLRSPDELKEDQWRAVIGKIQVAVDSEDI